MIEANGEPRAGILEGERPVGRRSPSLFDALLGTDRWRELFDALQSEWRRPLPALPLWTIALVSLCAVMVAIPPSAFVSELDPRTGANFTFVFLGIGTLVVLLLRSRYAVRSLRRISFLQSLRITHTGVALGCALAFPLIVYMLWGTDSSELRAAVLKGASRGPRGSHSYWVAYGFIILTSAWAAVTEEALFRAGVVSFFRRCPYIRTLKLRDAIAVVTGAALFGLAHLPTWGPTLALSVTALGVGFGAGFLANGERLIPIVAYHFIFDVISIFLSLHR